MSDPLGQPVQLTVVSAIATTLNCVSGLEECVERLAVQLDGHQFVEIVLVDGGSTDGTWEVLLSLAHANPEVRVYREPGATISRGRNLAVQRSRGNVILSFDSGCWMADDYVRLMTQPFLGDPGCAVVGGKTVAVGVTLFERCVAALQQGTPKDTFNPSSRAIAFRRSVFDAVAGYDESVLAGEDTHFNRKWRDAGYRYTHVPAAEVLWRVRPSLRSLYRMQQRNVTGCVTLGNPWGLVGLSTRLSVVSLIMCAIGLPAALAGSRLASFTAGTGIMVWLGYTLFRATRRGRWRYLLHPIRFPIAASAMLAMDLGTWSGTLREWILRWKRRS